MTKDKTRHLFLGTQRCGGVECQGGVSMGVIIPVEAKLSAPRQEPGATLSASFAKNAEP